MLAVRILLIVVTCKQTRGSGQREVEKRQDGQCKDRDKEAVQAGFISRCVEDVEHRPVGSQYEREYGLTPTIRAWRMGV